MASYNIAVLPGDGIGPEIVDEGLKVLRAVEEAFPDLQMNFASYDASVELYRRTGVALPQDVYDECMKADAIFFGAMGLPDVRLADGTEVAGEIIFRLRFDLDLYAYVDAMTLWQVQKPEFYDVVVTENMFGDIISDLAAGTVGGMGMAPSGDIGDNHGLFQPSHGSAPTIAGQGIANPIAAILSGSMMLEWLGIRHDDKNAREAAQRIEAAVSDVLEKDTLLTQDIGGKAKTREMGDAIAERVTIGG